MWIKSLSELQQSRKFFSYKGFNSNQLGLYDMSGNIWELVFDESGHGRVSSGGSRIDFAGLQVGCLGRLQAVRLGHHPGLPLCKVASLTSVLLLTPGRLWTSDSVRYCFFD